MWQNDAELEKNGTAVEQALWGLACPLAGRWEMD